MKNKCLILILFVSFLILFSCKKKEIIEPLPPNTETGQNTFIFRVNGGEIITSKVEYLSTSPRIHIYYSHIEPTYGSYFFGVDGGVLYLEEHKFVSIVVKSMTSIGKYLLSTENSSASYSDVKPVQLYYNTDANNTGELDITKLDTTNHIISGSFKFNAKNSKNDDIVTIDGQFDVKYKPNEGVNYY